MALEYLGAKCNSLTAVGCNPYQLPVFDPSKYFFERDLLLSVGNENVQFDGGYNLFTTFVSLDTDATHSSSSNAASFGIHGQASCPDENIAFSGGVQHQQLSQQMDVYLDARFYYESTRVKCTFQATLMHPERLPLTPAFAKQVAKLPQKAESEEEIAAYFNFFEAQGTHYIKHVDFGGSKKFRTSIRVAMQQDQRVDQSHNDWNMKALFNQSFGLGIDFDKDHTQDEFNAFGSYARDQYAFTFGGDGDEDDWQKWLPTVTDQKDCQDYWCSRPVATILGSVADLLPGKDVESALKLYYSACPHTSAFGICNGYGSCDWHAKACTCSSSEFYVEDDGNCYPKCPKDCSNNGRCYRGRCQCYVDENGFGHKSIDCSVPCGEHVFSAGSGVWNLPGHGMLDKCCGGPDCFCKDMTGKNEDAMISWTHSEHYKPFTNSYDCNGHKICNSAEFPWVPPGCTGMTSISCRYGAGGTCSKGIKVRRDIKPRFISLPFNSTALSR